MRPGLDGAVAQRFARVRKHEIEIDIDNPAKAAAGLTGAQRAIERKEIRHRIAIGDFTMRTMQVVAERLAAPIFLRQEEVQAPLAVMKRLLERIQNAFFVGVAEREPIDYDLQRLRFRRTVGQFVDFPYRPIQHQAVKSGLAETAPYIGSA